MDLYSSGRQVYGNFAALYGKATLHQVKRYDRLIMAFKRRYKASKCYLASSSGRVELIGNHTDHNGGKVVACTVGQDIVAAFLPNDNNKVVVSGNNYRDIVFDVDDIDRVEGGSIGMVKGVLSALKKSGKKVGGFYACLDSVLPVGAGLSSSAAFQMLCAEIENRLYNNGEIDALTMAKAGQYAENVYFNKPCGLLDQGAIAVGGIVKMDFENGFSAEQLNDELSKWSLVVVNTGKSHSSLTGYYAEICSDMKTVANFFGKDRLIGVDEKQFYDNFQQVAETIGERAALRAKHFFEENKRVDEACPALREGDDAAFLAAINASGDSSIYQLKNCNVGADRTIAQAVELARKVCPNCASRVHGGGFAGTILAVMDKSETKGFCAEMEKYYGKNNVMPLNVRHTGVTVL